MSCPKRGLMVYEERKQKISENENWIRVLQLWKIFFRHRLSMYIAPKF